jgi:hypothetical protein
MQRRKSSVSPLAADSEVTIDLLEIVAEVARSKWREIGLLLGFSNKELQEYEQKRQSCFIRLLQLLECWRQRERHPTVGAIIDACERAGVGGMVERAVRGEMQRKLHY